ncbi:hypothetical protein J2Z21_008341 [Streptomyces griseochromogenes]|uniref:Uncharacterized protein n=1 Tax=Streptomyces griseochromogenes TaxID=68214 RepID=A0ABS4M6L5_9ACTN|nr:hypothetical protein [Streptomyces griseochromogenes]MBP2055327.1 hypothetical protein [Streptomyces griseochromogenes]
MPSTVRRLTPSSDAFALIRSVSDRVAGSYSGRAGVPGSAPGGSPVSTSTTCRSHSTAAARADSGSVWSGPNGSISGDGSAPVTAKSGAAIKKGASTTDSAPPADRSRTAVPASATT